MSFETEIFFAGAGLLEIGLNEAGVRVHQSFEIDAKCCATQRRNFDHVVVQCDMRQKLVAHGRPEAMIATYPCNRYAEISALHGCLTGDELYLHFFRHLAIAQPEAFALENVPGMKKFPVVMEAMTKLPGYYVTAFCPVRSELWLPQRRDRLIIIGTRRAFAWRAPTSRRRVRLREIIERDPRVDIPSYVAKRMRGEYRDRPIISDPRRDDVAPTCVAHYAKDVSTRLVADRRFPRGVRPYSVREYARLQGVPDWFTFHGTDRDAYRQIGNGVSVPVGRWLGSELRRYFR